MSRVSYLHFLLGPILVLPTVSNAQNSAEFSCPSSFSTDQCTIAKKAAEDAFKQSLIKQLEQQRDEIVAQISTLEGNLTQAQGSSVDTLHSQKVGSTGTIFTENEARPAAFSIAPKDLEQTSNVNKNSAQSAIGANAPPVSAEEGKNLAKKEIDDALNRENVLEGLGFGLGIALTYDVGSNDRVKSAQLVNNIVRVTDQENVTARFLLESHYFFTPDRNFLGLDSKDWGIGPFIALEAGSDPVIQAMGAGLMVGLRRPNDEPNKPKSKQSFNFGLGFIYDLDSQLLGEGIIANQPLPEGETEIRFRNKEQFGILALTSFSF